MYYIWQYLSPHISVLQAVNVNHYISIHKYHLLGLPGVRLYAYVSFYIITLACQKNTSHYDYLKLLGCTLVKAS